MFLIGKQVCKLIQISEINYRHGKSIFLTILFNEIYFEKKFHVFYQELFFSIYIIHYKAMHVWIIQSLIYTLFLVVRLFFFINDNISCPKGVPYWEAGV